MGTALSAATMTLLHGAPPAHAATTGYIVSAGGSDTTEKMMTSILNHNLNGGGNGVGGGRNLPLASGTTVTIKSYNIPTRPGISSPTSPYVVPGETDGGSTDCPSDVSWVTGSPASPTEGQAPNGSGAGKAYLKAEEAANGRVNGHSGCVDVGRSSSPRGGTDPASFEYYAYALDAVSWATTSLKAPATLTTAQLQGIYQCTITDWAQLTGGTTGQIQRYLPNPASGTRGFFLSDVLQLAVGGSNGTGTFSEAAVGTPGTVDSQGRSLYCPAVKGDGTGGSTVIEENEANAIDTSDADKAILPFSAGQWSFQAQNSINPTLDQRNGARLGGTTTAPSSGTPKNNSTVFFGSLDGFYELNTPEAELANGTGSFAGVVSEANVKAENGNVAESGGTYPGIRFVWNVMDNAGNLRGYQAAIAMLGFDNSSTPAVVSPLCSGTHNFEYNAIQSAGFAPLNTTGGNTATGSSGDFNLAHSSCRKL